MNHFSQYSHFSSFVCFFTSFLNSKATIYITIFSATKRYLTTFSLLHSILIPTPHSNGSLRQLPRRCSAGANQPHSISRPQTLPPDPHSPPDRGYDLAHRLPLRSPEPELREESNAGEAQLRHNPARLQGDRGGAQN